MLKKGIFGTELKQQVIIIALTYCIVSIIGISIGFLLYLHPEKFEYEPSRKNDQQPMTDSPIYDDATVTLNFGKNETETDLEDFEEDIESQEEDDEIGVEYQEEDNDLKRRISKQHLENEGLEAIVGSFLKLLCSMILFQGIRNSKHLFLLPWLVEESIEMITGIIFFILQESSSDRWSPLSFLLGLIFYMLGGYFLYSVASYYDILRRRKNNSDIIVQSVSQGVTGGYQDGMNYQRLEEEAWQSEPNLSSEFNRGQDERDGGFRREKKVGDDDNDEHVLYVQ